MKIAIITDQHFGARKNSKLFHDYFLRFYNDVFFPTLEEQGITTIVDMGDTFDSRKGIDFSALSWAKNNYYDKLKDYTIHTIVGNHTAYYKNTNEVNAIDLLLREYKNVKIYSETTTIKLGDLNILLVPWINSENEKSTLGLGAHTEIYKSQKPGETETIAIRPDFNRLVIFPAKNIHKGYSFTDPNAPMRLSIAWKLI